jgi:hypothetical protein
MLGATPPLPPPQRKATELEPTVRQQVPRAGDGVPGGRRRNRRDVEGRTTPGAVQHHQAGGAGLVILGGEVITKSVFSTLDQRMTKVYRTPSCCKEKT